MEEFKDLKTGLEEALEAYHDQMDMIARRTRELTQAIEDGQKNLALLQQSYKDAMTNLDEEKADEIFERMDTVTKSIKNNTNKLFILQSNDPLKNPAIQRIATEFVEATVPYFPKINEVFEKKSEEVKIAQQEYVKKLVELEHLHYYAMGYENEFSEIARLADKDTNLKHKVQPKLGTKHFKKVSHRDFFIGNHNYEELRRGK